jgi:cobalt-precorrin-5B (C1)-methyltransferase
MGDFVGGMLKYLKGHPLPRVTIAGGFAKLTKLAQGNLDLHSARSQVDLDRLAAMAGTLGATPDIQESIRGANTAAQALEFAPALPDAVARAAQTEALRVLSGNIAVDILVVDRQGRAIGHAGP